MTTVRQATRRDVATPAPTPAPRPRSTTPVGGAPPGAHAARARQRRLLREQLLAVVVLLVLLTATLALLGMEWLGASPGTSPSAPPPTTSQGGAP